MDMQTKKNGTESNWVDPDDAPHLTKEWFEAGEVSIGNKVIRPARPPGRPKSETPKEPVSIRLDGDVLEYFRKAGPGWQSRINEALRKVAGL
jgi:uncharacterized protein (DUF4415 family)